LILSSTFSLRGIPLSKIRSRTVPVVSNISVPVQTLDAGRRALLVDGVVQSVHPDDAASGYWSRMLPDRSPKSALLLGMGGGTVARLLVQRFGPIAITGVDDSAEMLAIAKEFGPPITALRLVQDDASAFLHRDTGRYGFIAVDLFRADRPAQGVLALPFIRALAARLEPNGTVAYNIFQDSRLRDRVAKLERVFERLRVDEIGENAVFHGRPYRLIR
jgi:spermidine synthase